MPTSRSPSAHVATKSNTGESLKVKKQRRTYLRLTQPQRKYDGPEARAIREFVTKEVQPHCHHKRHSQRALRWLKEFGAWAGPFRYAEADRRGEEPVVQTLQEMLVCDELCRLFVSNLMKQKKGFSVPRAARRYLSGARLRLKMKSLNGDVALGERIRGYERSMPRTAVQRLSLALDDMHRIVEAYGGSDDWWEVQTALWTALGFTAILRLIELLLVSIEGVHIVGHSFGEVSASTVEVLPHHEQVKGLFVHLVWRKAQQTHDVWIPVACRAVIRLMMRHLAMLRAEGRRTGPLFTARTRKGGRRHARNRLSSDSAVRALRATLIEVCGMTKPQTRLYAGHSLRVGGSNFIRRKGIDDEVHRLLGGWASLTSSRGYFQLLDDEQWDLAEQFTLEERETPRNPGGRPVDLSAVLRINLDG